MNNFCMQKRIKENVVVGYDEEGNEQVKEVTFYAIPMGTTLKLKSVGKQAAGLVSVLMADGSKDTAKETITRASDRADAEGNAYVDTVTTISEISPSMASFRHKQITDAVGGLLDAVTSDELMEVLCEVIVKSAKDELTGLNPKELPELMDLGTMFQFLKGAFKASAGGIGELGKLLPQSAKKNLEKVKGEVNDVLKTQM